MKTILLVEDDALLSNLLQTKMAKEGYEIIPAKDGQEALGILSTRAFDLILLDILMPRMNGIEFLEQLRADKRWKKVPVIIISNSGEPFTDEDAKKFGIADYLVKANFSPAEVIEKVRTQIGGSSAAEQQPVEQASVAPQEQAAAEAPRAGNKVRLLVVEDDEFLRELIVTKLINEGFEVIEAIDGEDGLRKIREEKPQLVLLDIILPSIDGFEVLKQLKADPAIASIPVVMLSNLGQQDDVERALTLGAKDYLIKAHFTPREIIEKIKSVLATK